MLVAGAQTAGAGIPKPSTEKSRHWAGYVVTHQAGKRLTFTTVKATWTQPKVTCHDADAGARLAIWVGLGGYDPAPPKGFVQAGVGTQCDRAKNLLVYAWYEIPPAF